MNEHLLNALKELEGAEAENIPTAEDATLAVDGTEWSGKLKDNGDWKLIKHSVDSYTSNTRLFS